MVVVNWIDSILKTLINCAWLCIYIHHRNKNSWNLSKIFLRIMCIKYKCYLKRRILASMVGMLACVEKKKKAEIKMSTIVIFCIIFFYLRKHNPLNSNILVIHFFPQWIHTVEIYFCLQVKAYNYIKPTQWVIECLLCGSDSESLYLCCSV